jgi:hypothetical protein
MLNWNAKPTAWRWIVTICCAISLSIPATAATVISAASVAFPVQEERESETKPGEGATVSLRESRIERPSRSVPSAVVNIPRCIASFSILPDVRFELSTRYMSLRC